MSTLVESVGGTTRIILAYNNSTGGHAYTEVYLGNLNTQRNNVEEILDWLRDKYNSKLIYYHVDANTNDAWLNLDWGTDEKGSVHPGGPFYPGDQHFVVIIREVIQSSLNVPDAYKLHKQSEDLRIKGFDHYIQKNYDDAIADINKALQIEPSNGAALRLKADLLAV